jgi:hypothetical protein
MMQRWASLLRFAPAFPAQAAFCADPRRIVVANAAIRTGKTYAAAPKFLARVRAELRKPGFKTYWVIAPTYEEGIAQKIELARLIPPHCVDARLQGNDSRWRNLKQGGGKVWLKGNALIEFKSAERSEGLVARKVHGVWWTEIARSKYAAWPNVRGRLANTMGWLIADTSPFGHSWFYNDILKPALPDVGVHRWTALDSPFIPRAEVEAARLSLPKAFFERDYMASDDVFMGQIYDLDDALHVRAAPPFNPSHAFVVADVNTTSTHPAEFIWALADGEGVNARAWIEGAYRRNIGADYALYAQDIARHVAELKARYPRVVFVLDPSAHGELKQRLRLHGVSITLAENDVLAGIRTLGSALMPGAAGVPRLTFAPAARDAYAQLKAQRWVIDGDGIVKARPDKTLDDGWADCLRYLAHTAMRSHRVVQVR